jgi:hypothetical protein
MSEKGARKTDAERGRDAFSKAIPIFSVIAFCPFIQSGLAAQNICLLLLAGYYTSSAFLHMYKPSKVGPIFVKVS